MNNKFKQHSPSLIFLLSLFVLNSLNAQAIDGIDWSIWTITETKHVLRDDPPGDNLPVSLASAKNEWESFQVFVRVDQTIKDVSLEPGNLLGPNGSKIESKDARLYRQHQIKIDKGTFRNKAFKKGWYPDPLIPFDHPISRSKLKPASLMAVPIDLKPDQNVGFWVDIFVPPNQEAGDYSGTYIIKSGGKKIQEIPVSLKVWDFDLPQTPTFQNHFGSPTDSIRSYDEALKTMGLVKKIKSRNWETMHLQISELLSRHRLNAVPRYGSITPVEKRDGSFEVTEKEIDDLRKFIDTYHVNAIEIPVVRHRFPRLTSVITSIKTEAPKLIAWIQCWDLIIKKIDRPEVQFYIYLFDEPNKPEEYEFVRQWGKVIKSVKSAVKILVVEQTTPQSKKVGDLYGAVDIWCPHFIAFNKERASQRQALGESLWTYTAQTQGKETPWWQTDFPLLNYRLPAWMAWKNSIKGLLYWGGLCYWNQKPWESALTWKSGRLKQNSYNGEGSLVYPAENVGYEGIAPSMRLKALRDSIEDYEYLSILAKIGMKNQAEEALGSCVESWFEWKKDPACIENARKNLAELIVSNLNKTIKKDAP